MPAEALACGTSIRLREGGEEEGLVASKSYGRAVCVRKNNTSLSRAVLIQVEIWNEFTFIINFTLKK